MLHIRSKLSQQRNKLLQAGREPSAQVSEPVTFAKEGCNSGEAQFLRKYGETYYQRGELK